jgi:hypothetical protein
VIFGTTTVSGIISTGMLTSFGEIVFALLAIPLLFNFLRPACFLALITFTSSFTMIAVGKSSHYSVAILFNSFLGYTVFPISMFMFYAIKK